MLFDTVDFTALNKSSYFNSNESLLHLYYTVTHFLTALKLDPKNETAKMNLASAYASSKQYDKAKNVYTEVLQRNQNNLDAYVELAKVCIALQDNVNAEKYLIAVQAKNASFRKAEVAELLKSVK